MIDNNLNGQERADNGLKDHHDGVLDIIVDGASLLDWERLVSDVLGSYPSTFRWDDQVAPFPGKVADIVRMKNQALPTLEFRTGSVVISTHFFAEDQIEFNFHTRSLESKEDTEGVLEFMVTMGNVLGKTVVLAPEGGREYPLYRYDPGSNRPRYLPPP